MVPSNENFKLNNRSDDENLNRIEFGLCPPMAGQKTGVSSIVRGVCWQVTPKSDDGPDESDDGLGDGKFLHDFVLHKL